MMRADDDKSAVWILIALPSLVLAGSYAYLVAYHERLNLIDTIVHEGGRHTLLQTMLYWDHFLGMIPHLVVVIAALVSACLLYGPPTRDNPAVNESDILRRRIAAAGGCCAALVAASFLMSVRAVGWTDTMAYLLQNKERVALVTPGGNWRMMVTADLGNGFGVFLAALCFRVLIMREVPEVHRAWWWPLAGAVGMFVGISIVKGVTLESFLSPRWLAHNVREFATFPLTVLPLSLASVHYCERIYPRRGVRSALPSRVSSVIARQAAVLAAIVLTVVVWHVLVALSQDIGEMAQKPAFARNGRLSIQYLLAFHYFEHALDYLFAVPLTAFIYSVTVLGSSRQRARWQGLA